MRWLQNLVLLIFGTVLALVLAEALARLAWVDAPIAVVSDPPPPGLAEIRSLRAVEHANVRAIHRGVLFETNRDGFRDREYTRVKPSGTTRLVIIGDSFAMAQGVAVEHGYAERLERMLAEQPGGPYEVLNMGLSGLAIDRIHERLIRLGMPFDPDLVVYGLTLNDIQGRRYRKVTHRFSFIQQRLRYNRYRESPSRLLRLLWPRFQSLRELLKPPPDSYLKELLVNYDESAPAWADFAREMQRFGETQRRSKVPIVIFIHTELFYLNLFHPFHDIYAQIEAEAERAGLRVIRTFPAFRGVDPMSVWVGEHDFHPNARGHEILAHVLHRELLRLADEGQGNWPVAMPALGTRSRAAAR